MPNILDPANVGQPIGFLVRREDLVLVMKVGTDEICAQLSPQAALEIARDLLVAGLEHAEARAMQRVNADAVAAGVIGKASSH
ncbi:MAG: hypothetical protein KJ007_13230 [Burkholderiales bacterium]|nr:hypothetical protein [Burkholderiales bacterium]